MTYLIQNDENKKICYSWSYLARETLLWRL